MATTFANHAAVALELAERASDQQPRSCCSRTATASPRDLHDHVIQRLFAAGLTLQSAPGRSTDAAAGGAQRVDVVDDIDETIRQIRTTIFELHGRSGPRRVAAGQVLAIVDEMTPALGFEPQVASRAGRHGRRRRVVDDLVAVAARGTDQRRPARRGHDGRRCDREPTSISTSTSIDDGVGIGDSTRRSGLDNCGAGRRAAATLDRRQSTRREGPAEMDDSDPEGEHRRPIRVFLLDDHEVVRRGIADLLEHRPRHRASSARPRTAQRRCAASRPPRPDVAILDARLPDGSGIDVCRDIRSAHARGPLPDPDVLRRRRRAAGRGDGRRSPGYLLKEIRGVQPRRRDPQVAAGRSLLDPAVTAQAARSAARRRTDPRLAALTEREREILGLIADGLTNRQIGERIFLAEKTVKNYVSALLASSACNAAPRRPCFGAELKR